MLNSPFHSPKDKDEALLKWAGDPEEVLGYMGVCRRSGWFTPLWKNAVILVKPFAIPSYWSRIVIYDLLPLVHCWFMACCQSEGDYFAFENDYERERTVIEHAKSLMMLWQGSQLTIGY